MYLLIIILLDFSHIQNTTEKIEILKNRLNEAHKTIELKRKETKENIERRTKAEWAISLCNSRVIFKTN
jgi:hypothetical protein